MLSRFWYLALAVAAAAGIGAALLAQGVINTRSDTHVEASLLRDRLELEALLRLEARSRLDRIAFITVDNRVGGLLSRAHEVEDAQRLRELGADLKEAMRSHVTRLVEAAPGSESAEEKRKLVAPALAFTLDRAGRIIAQLGPLEANPPGAGLGTFPLVRRALQGYVRDDVWVYDRRVYRMAARPVMAGTEYAGAVVHGYAFDNDFARKLSEQLGGPTVVFFYGTTVLASHSPTEVHGAPQHAEIAAELPKVLADAKFLKGERTDLLTLQAGGRAVFAPIVGSASAAGVGYALARPRPLIASPQQLFEEASKDDVRALPFPVLGGGALVLALLGMFFLWVEKDRHLGTISKKTAEILSGDRERLIITEWRGPFRKLADQINQAIDKEVERAAHMVPGRKKKAALDEILGPTGDTTGPFFGFASDAKAPATSEPARAASSPGLAPPARAPSPPAVQPRPAPPAAPVAPARSGSPVTSAAPMTSLAPADANGGDVDEATHWQEVYEQYLAMRRQCGEAVDTLTFQKFEVTLRKTRDQILGKHDAKAVRFSVYEKQGKAALRAQPVRK